MRADRLISLLMLLQSRGRLTARQLAEELEVSERTILRDIDALSASGVPVYADRGPAGGFALLDNYRTDLSGLTESELRAVFLLSIPSAFADLGLDKALASALRKLSASITVRRGEEVRVRERYYLDPRRWRIASSPAPQLSRLQKAVWNDYRAWIRYRLASGATAEQWIHSYGLVCREGLWYVIYISESRAQAGGWTNDHVQALPLSSLVEVEVTSEPFARRQDFELIKVWQHWCSRNSVRPFHLTLLAAPDIAARLTYYGIDGFPSKDIPPDAEGRLTVKATCPTFEDARARVLALGRAVEVVAPEPLRRSLIDYAEQILARYVTSPAPRPGPPPA